MRQYKSEYDLRLTCRVHTSAARLRIHTAILLQQYSMRLRVTSAVIYKRQKTEELKKKRSKVRSEIYIDAVQFPLPVAFQSLKKTDSSTFSASKVKGIKCS